MSIRSSRKILRTQERRKAHPWWNHALNKFCTLPRLPCLGSHMQLWPDTGFFIVRILKWTFLGPTPPENPLTWVRPGQTCVPPASPGCGRA